MVLKLTCRHICVFLFFSFSAVSQQRTYSGDPDKTFEVARNLAFNQQRKQAQDSLLFILTKYPDYHDVRAFLGSTYSWDGSYKLAQKEFMYVLKKDSKRKDTWIAVINNELWAESPFKALEFSKDALKYFPNDTEILYKKASSEENANNPEEALITIDLILENEPDNKKALDYRESLVLKLSYNTIGIKTAVSLYSDVYDPAQYYGLRYSRRTKHVSILAKLNHSRRFETGGFQFEVDLYPKIASGFYGYLNVGFSGTPLFPSVRYGAELHKSLPKSFEISLGFRALKYSSMTYIYTGSVTWYTGNDYWSFRPYITPGNPGTSMSGTINYRKYRSDADNYFSYTFGMGFSPEFYRFNLGDIGDVVDLKSQKMGVGYYLTTKRKQHLFGAEFGVIHQELSFDLGNYYWMYTFALSWDFKFR